jgi:membrane fusion protein, multidrug efflux system
MKLLRVPNSKSENTKPMSKNIIALFVIAVTFASCGGDSGNSTDALKEQLKGKQAELEAIRAEIAQLEIDIATAEGSTTAAGKPVMLETLSYTSFAHSIDIQGKVDAEGSVSVGPAMPGLVKRVNVHAGDKVSAGQVLAEIDADALNQQLAALKLQRDLAKEVFDRQKNLWDQKIGTEVQYLSAKTQFDALERQVSSMQEQIEMAKVKAPVSGVVDAVNIKAGELASPGYSNITIVNTGDLAVKGEVAEAYVAKVKTGSPVSIYLPDANKTINTKVTYAGKMINNINRTFNVEVALAGNEENVVPNMIAVMKISDYQNDSAIVIPLALIQQNANGTNYVYVAVQSAAGLVAEKREITYTWTYEGKAEITSGLKTGDQLIIEGANDINAGDVLAPQK